MAVRAYIDDAAHRLVLLIADGATTGRRSRSESQAGVIVTTGSGLLCFGLAERYLGM
jgi:hypothetical protein